MPKNGEEVKIETVTLDDNPDYQLACRLITQLRDYWVKLNEAEEGEGFDPVKFSRLNIVAFTHWAALLAVDTQMPPDQFMNVCLAQFKSAYENASKFG